MTISNVGLILEGKAYSENELIDLMDDKSKDVDKVRLRFLLDEIVDWKKLVLKRHIKFINCFLENYNLNKIGKIFEYDSEGINNLFCKIKLTLELIYKYKKEKGLKSNIYDKDYYNNHYLNIYEPFNKNITNRINNKDINEILKNYKNRKIDINKVDVNKTINLFDLKNVNFHSMSPNAKLIFKLISKCEDWENVVDNKLNIDIIKLMLQGYSFSYISESYKIDRKDIYKNLFKRRKNSVVSKLKEENKKNKN